MSFAVAAGHRQTAEAAAEVLRADGSAVDAVIAGACTAMVAEPVLASLLGGGFLMVAPADGPVRCLDAFVQAPSEALAEGDADVETVEADFGGARQVFHIGAGTVAVPGLAAALFEAHARHGRMDLADLLAPAAGMARAGVTVTAYQAHLFQVVAPIFRADPAVRRLYAPDDSLPTEGTVLRNSAFADVLDVLAAEGPRFVQEGEIAAALADLPGAHLSRADLAAYAPTWLRPQRLRRGTAEIALTPPPSLGGLMIALALSHLPARPGAAEIAQAFQQVEIARAGKHTSLDPALVAEMRRVSTAHTLSARGTTHLSVVDAAGNGAALTLSNGTGAGRLVPGTGIMPNNMLGEEDLLPDGPTSWRPAQRLASMMCPTVLSRPDGSRTLLGSGGSNRIRTALAQVLLHLADHGAPLDEAIAAPRVHLEGARTPRLDVEAGWSEETVAHLCQIWPEATFWAQSSMFFGGVHAVTTGPRGSTGAGDPRRDGQVILG
ncbi:MAG: gamma-glutamyltransferase [Pseudomonadota bacterium]